MVLKTNTIALALDGEIVFLAAGTKVPDWAEDQFKNSPHLFEDQEDATGSQRVEAKVNPVPDATEVEAAKEELAKLGIPSTRAGAATWVKFAESLGIELKDGLKRDEIVELVKNQKPELFD